MLELTALGHATLYVRSPEATVLCDPILGPTVSGGGNLIDPPRKIDTSQLGRLDAVLISHHHSDHFSLEDLASIPGVEGLRFVVARGSLVAHHLRRRGWSNIQEIAPGESLILNDLRITATPSGVDFPEVGFLFEAHEAAALNLVDTWIGPVVDALVDLLPARVDLALAPFQAGGYMSFLPLRVGGPPPELAKHCLAWAKEGTAELVDALARFRPSLVVPFADGIRYLDEAMNAWHFPLPDEFFQMELAARGIRSEVMETGTRLTVLPGQVISGKHHGLVKPLAQSHSERIFDCTRRISDTPTARHTLPPGAKAGILRKWGKPQLTALIEGMHRSLDAWIASHPPDSPKFAEMEELLAEWFLELCDDVQSPTCITASLAPSINVVEQDDTRARPFGVRAHGLDLLDIITGWIPLEFLHLSGAFRYHSPADFTSLEGIRRRVFGPLTAVLTDRPINHST